jgi:predicted nucleic acid-binding protein
MRIFLDTSVLVASLVSTHPHHQAAMAVVRRVLSAKDEGTVAAHGVAETYAVLTTLPVSPRIGPEVARRLITDNVVAHFQTIALTSREHERLIDGLAENGIAGGTTYDALQAACAEKAGASRLYTFNVGHFRRVAPHLAKRIVAP